MKRIFISVLVAVAFMAKPVQAQEVTVKSLLALLSQCKEFDCFNTYASDRKFCFESTKDGTSQWRSCQATTVEGHPEITNKDGLVQLISSMAGLTTWSYSISTSNVSTFNRMNKEVQAMGFKSTKTDQLGEGQILVSYKSTMRPEILLGVQTANLTKPGVGSWTMWSISVTNTE